MRRGAGSTAAPATASIERGAPTDAASAEPAAPPAPAGPAADARPATDARPAAPGAGPTRAGPPTPAGARDVASATDSRPLGDDRGAAAGRALLYLRTLPTLHWRQVVYRPVRAWQRRGAAPPAIPAELDAPRAQAAAALLLRLGAEDPGRALRRAGEVCEGTFRFLNTAVELPTPDWNGRYVGPLWTYNLHYFDYAPDLVWAFHASGDRSYLERLEALVSGWIDATGPGRGAAWDPYVVATRAVNWIRALLVAGPALDPGLRGNMIQSLHRQLRHLDRRLEWHLMGNHLQRDLHALAVAGLLFEGRDAARWRGARTRLLWKEAAAQFLPDGGHAERSPMYHALALGDFLELVALRQALGDPVPDDVESRLDAALAAYGRLLRGDDTLHGFNDTAEGVAPSAAWLDRVGRIALGRGVPPPDGAWMLPDSGYYGFADGAAGERFVIDCGPPGPRSQPGHAHCDVLSFELALGGRAVVVDSGVAGYDGDPLREYVRSTRAHNTVTIAGGEQSEVWATFRMARRAEVVAAVQEAAGPAYRFHGAYRPYHDRGAVHARTVLRTPAGWTVEDRVAGATGARLASFLHLHPDLRIEHDGDRWVASAPGLTVVVEPFGADRTVLRRGERDPAQGWFCPEFGRRIAAPVLELEVGANAGAPFGYHIRLADRG